MKYDLAVFDLDGTLLDTLDDLADSVNFALRSFGYPERTREQTRLSVGNGVGVLMKLSLPGGDASPDYQNCLSLFKEHYSANNAVKTKPYEGITELLTALCREGCKIAVVSNKYDAAAKHLCDIYFPGLISIAIGESTDVRRKPYPDMVFKAIRESGASASDAVYIGDSETDILTAKNAGIPCVSVLWGFRDEAFLDESGALKKAATPENLLEILI